MDSIQLDELSKRVDRLEARDKQDLLTLLEIMSNITFFGGMKKTSCLHAKEEQCSMFYLKRDSPYKIPIATDCRIKDCTDPTEHRHLEVSNVTCSFCPQWNNDQQATKPDYKKFSRRKK